MKLLAALALASALTLSCRVPPAVADGGGDGGGAAGGGAGGGAVPPGPYAVDGPATVSTFTATLNNSNNLSVFSVTVYLPSTSGPHPVVSLSAGLQQPPDPYAAYGQRLASHGIVAVLRGDPGFLRSTTSVTSDLTYLVGTWLPAEHARAQSPLFGQLDLARVGLAGHSRGGKASLLAAEGGLKGKVVAWFGLDPVDAPVVPTDPKARTTLATIGVPLAFLGAEVSSNCSPAADNYAVLYDAAASPAVELTAVGAGHVQLEAPAGCVSCSACTPAGTADGAAVLELAVRSLTAFFARELLGDAAVGADLSGAGLAADQSAGRLTVRTK